MIAIVVIWYLDIILVIRDMIDSVVNMINTMILGNLPIYIYHQLLGNNTHIYMYGILILYDIILKLLDTLIYWYQY